jgi:hypothetical protein
MNDEKVTIGNFDMPFGDLVVFMTKVILAAIPALFISGVVLFMIYMLFMAVVIWF